MDDELLNMVQNGSQEDIVKVLTEFNRKNAATFCFPEWNLNKKKRLIDGIYHHLKDKSATQCHRVCLESIRILSREKKNLDELFNEDIVDTMVYLAGLLGCEENQSIHQSDLKVINEAQKSLCNLIFNSTVVQRICCNNKCLDGIMMRLKTFKDSNLPHEIKFFDMRMLFLLTALCADVRPKLRCEHHGLIYLMEIVDLIMKSNAERNQNYYRGRKRFSKSSRRGRGQTQDSDSFLIPCLDDDEVDLACEVLKILFNLTVSVDRLNLEEEDEAHFMRLVSILHDILLCETKSVEKQEELQSHTVNLLTNMPHSSYEELLTPLTDIPGGKSEKELEYEGMNMEAVAILLSFLEKRLEQKSMISQKESLSPILSCLGECARSNRIIRKWLKGKILPPLKDVMKKPEEGDSLRNRLVRLMTCVCTDVKELVADLLFVLCKENVGRLVKYTGYGNAAGLLANRGLMRGGQGSGACNYSSESEDSETEEYLAYKEKINPVTGCYEEPKPNPLEGMSDEQKEYEAMQLVNIMDKLSRSGVVQPIKLADDGTPCPVEHILELQEGITIKEEDIQKDPDSD